MSDANGPARALSGWALLAVLLGYAAFLHHGLGPYPDGAVELWSPRAFLLRQPWITTFETKPALGVLAFALPAVLGAAAVFALSRSAFARTLALGSVIAGALFSFYGLHPPGPGIWKFFGWRGSAVMVGMAFALAATIDAPLLARSWLRLPTAARAAVYLPVLLGVVMLMRNVTGTNPALRFAISPWPVIPLFGLKIGSLAVLGVIAGMACAAWGFSGHEPGARPATARRAAGLLVGLLLPALWFKLWHRSFPLRDMIAMTGAAAFFVAGAALLGRRERRGLRTRHLAWGFLLAVLPIAAGQAWARYDYSRTREGSARIVIDALATYYAQHDEYPETLPELVSGGFLATIPRPTIGFRWIESQEFEYQGFGTSYNLEFSSPDWVQCAYNPPWSEEDFDDDDADEAAEAPSGDAGGETAEDEALGESWSCPSSPPELW